jgi:chromosome segregation ATPase
MKQPRLDLEQVKAQLVNAKNQVQRHQGDLIELENRLKSTEEARINARDERDFDRAMQLGADRTALVSLRDDTQTMFEQATAALDEIEQQQEALEHRNRVEDAARLEGEAAQAYRTRFSEAIAAIDAAIPELETLMATWQNAAQARHHIEKQRVTPETLNAVPVLHNVRREFNPPNPLDETKDRGPFGVMIAQEISNRATRSAESAFRAQREASRVKVLS